eukprot:30773-Pelagococcus_subviridis.AAC.10
MCEKTVLETFVLAGSLVRESSPARRRRPRRPAVVCVCVCLRDRPTPRRRPSSQSSVVIGRTHGVLIKPPPCSHQHAESESVPVASRRVSTTRVDSSPREGTALVCSVAKCGRAPASVEKSSRECRERPSA